MALLSEDEALKTVTRLNAKLARQRRALQLFDDYYAGRFPLPYIPGEDQAEFLQLLRRARLNWCRKVIDIASRRLVLGSISSPASADDAKKLWAVWEAANMGVKSKMAQKSALRYGLSYVQVGRRQRDNATSIRPMSPMRTVHDIDPDEPEIPLNVMSVAYDDKDSVSPTRYWLWTPDEWWIINPRPRRRADRIVDHGEHKMGRNPVVVLRNQPDEDGGWASDLLGLTDVQDGLNQTLADRLMTQSYGAYKQWLLIGWTPELDDDGKPINTLRPAVNRFMYLDDDPTKIEAHEFTATDLEPILKAVEQDVQHMAALSDTPAHYLLGQMVNISAEALKAAESGLSAKVGDRQEWFADGWEDVFRLVAIQEGITPDPALQAKWKDTEPYSEAQRMDALTKKKALGVDDEILWSEMGYAPEDVADLVKKRDARERRQARNTATSIGVAPDAATDPAPVDPAA